MENVGEGEGTETSRFDNHALHDTPPSARCSAPQSVKDGKDGAIQLTNTIGMEDVANREDATAQSDMIKIEEQAPHGTPNNPSQNEKDDTNETGTLIDGAEYPTGLRFGFIILALSAVVVLVNLDMNIVATAMPAITDHFHTVADVGCALCNSDNILVQSTPLQVRPIWLRLGTALEGAAMLSGLLFGGDLVQYTSWRWCFYINLPLGSLAALLTLFCIRDKPKCTSIAQVTTTEKIADVDIGGTKYQWGSGTIIGLLVTTGVLLIAFVVNQLRRGDRAALPPRLMRHRSVAAGFLSMFFMNSAGQTFEYHLPTYYQTVQGYTSAQSGYLLLPFIILGSIGAVLAGFCVSKFGYYTPFLLAGTVVMTVAAGLVTTFNVHTSLAKLIGYTCIWGIGNGISFGMSSVAVQAVLAAGDVPLGLSFIFFAQSLGHLLAIVIGDLIFQTKLNCQSDIR